MNRFIPALLLSILLAPLPALAADWPQWRGPGRDGVAPGFQAPAKWPAAPTKVWSVEVGAGHSGPAVAGGRVFVHARQGDDEVIAAHDLATGKQVWRDAYPAAFSPKPEAARHGKGPFSTPTVADGRVFAFGVNGVLSAYQAESGKLLWRKDLGKEMGAPGPYYGTSLSPLVDGGLVVVHAGGPGKGALLGLDAATGAQRWRREADGPGYASPVAADLGGVRQAVTLTQARLVGVALADGALLWEAPFQVPYDQGILTPVISGDLVLVSGEDMETQAFRITRKQGKLAADKVWGNRAVAMYMSSPVLADGLLYGFSSMKKGHLFALDPKTGTVRWQAEGGQGDHAALIAAGDVLLVLQDTADLRVVARTGEGYRELARYDVAEAATWAHPAVIDGKLLIKDAVRLTLWSFAPGAAAAR